MKQSSKIHTVPYHSYSIFKWLNLGSYQRHFESTTKMLSSFGYLFVGANVIWLMVPSQRCFYNNPVRKKGFGRVWVLLIYNLQDYPRQLAGLWP